MRRATCGKYAKYAAIAYSHKTDMPNLSEPGESVICRPESARWMIQSFLKHRNVDELCISVKWHVDHRSTSVCQHPSLIC